jgi:gliding motility-associated-like protein
VPASAPPYDSVNFRNPYSLSNVLGGTAMQIHPTLGILTATPGSLGQFVYGVSVLEYRNGVLIGQTVRDYQVNVVSCPQITVASIFSPTIACGTLEADFINTSYNAASYRWDFGDTTTLFDSSSIKNPSYAYPDTGDYTVTLIAYSGVNPSCNDTTTGLVHVYPEFISLFSLTNDHCSPEFQFFDQSYGVSGIPNFWLWTFGDNSFSVMQNPQHLYQTPGTYPVTLITSADSACYDTVTTSITVLRNPVASFIPIVDTCEYQVRLRNISAFNTTNRWDFGDNILGFDSQPTHQYLYPGNYTLTLEVTTDSFCVDTESVNIYIPPLPVPSFGYSSLPCDSSVTFSNASQLSSSWRWNFGDGETSTDFEPVHMYDIGGSIPVSLTAISDFGCEIKLTDSIYLLRYKEATFNPQLDSCSGIVTFLDVSKNAPSYYWDFGDGTYSNSPSPSHMYAENKQYEITLITNNETDCASRFSKTINNELPLGEIVYVPNTFTPNGDGVNDIFKVSTFRPCSLYSLIVYNRWGQKIYEVDDVIDTNWDGTYEGNLCQNDLYVYILKGNGKERKGYINLLR